MTATAASYGPVDTVPKVDAVEKATGAASFTVDIRLPNMLYGRMLRSPHPHARILDIDASAALKLPGVRRRADPPGCAACCTPGSRNHAPARVHAISTYSKILCALSEMAWRLLLPSARRSPRKRSI